jgi:3-phosphoshikimate 1-carboxyvinyltransferase
MRLMVRQTTNPIEGRIVVPASRHHLHRALILASLAPGMSRIAGRCDAGHVRATISALRALGTRVEADGDDLLVLGGAYRPDRSELSVGGSSTTLYLLTGLASLAESPVTIVGQHRLGRRPIGPLLTALRDIGVWLAPADGHLPIAIRPHRPTGGQVRISGDLAEWICGLLVLAPFATKRTVIIVEGEFTEPDCVASTVRMMRAFGLEVRVATNGRMFTVEPNQRAVPTTVVVPPDLGAAAFGLAAAALHPADVIFDGLTPDVDHPESDLLRILADMGVPVGTDESGSVRVRHQGIRLAPVRVDCRAAPHLLPVLSVLGALADGTSRFDNGTHAGFAEPDRLAAISQLNAMGARLELQGDQLRCHGVDRLTATSLSTFNDHRALMSLAVAGTVADGVTTLTFPNAHRASYPGFLADMGRLGLDMSLVRNTGEPVRTKAEFPDPPGGPTRIGPRAPETRGIQPTALAVGDVPARPLPGNDLRAKIVTVRDQRPP